MIVRTAFAAAFLSLLTFVPAIAFQDAPTETESAVRPAADPADVASPDAILTAVYDVISGPAGAPRDWDRFKSLFVDGARLMPRNPQAATGLTVLSPAAFAERFAANTAEAGFYEIEIGRVSESWNDIVHAFSSYEGRRNADDAEPFLRGINSFQLIRHDGRWWIVSILWQPESAETPIPEKYLGR